MTLSVVVAFNTPDDARRFLDMVHDLPADPTSRELRVASPPKDKKVSISRYKIRAAYLVDDYPSLRQALEEYMASTDRYKVIDGQKHYTASDIRAILDKHRRA